MPLTLDAPFILASASPRRSELLSSLGLEFTVCPSAADESALPGETPEEHVLRLAGEKALAVGLPHPDAWVLGADTIVLIDGDILGKPAAEADARAMLGRLSGRTHEVFTGFALIHPARGIVRVHYVRSCVTFRDIPEDEIAWYVATPEPYDKAGAYAVQGKGAFFIREIRGSYTNVMGLPLCEVVDTLKSVRALTF